MQHEICYHSLMAIRWSLADYNAKFNHHIAIASAVVSLLLIHGSSSCCQNFKLYQKFWFPKLVEGLLSD